MIIVDTKVNRINGGEGHDVVHGNELDETISGGRGNDTIYGYGGNDYLAGNTGSDVLIGGSGNDTLVGGKNADSYMFESGWGNDVIISENFHSLNSLCFQGSLGTIEFRKDHHNLILCSVNNDSITLNNWFKWKRYQTMNITGNDTVGEWKYKLKTAATKADGNNKLIARAGEMVLGLGGNDTIYGGAGDSALYGGPGCDVYILGSRMTKGNDIIMASIDNINDCIQFKGMDIDDVSIGMDNDNLILTKKNGGKVILEDWAWGGDYRLNQFQFRSGRYFLFDNEWTKATSSPVFSVSDACVTEGGLLQINVTRLGNITMAASLDYTTADGTALAGSDYTAQSGTLTFAAGEINQNVTIAVADDDKVEGNEFFRLCLSNPTKGDIKTDTAAITIVDNNLIEGTASPEILTGTVRNEDIEGFDGNDTLWGLDGNDTLIGGAGADVIEAGDGNDLIWFDSLDTIHGGNGTDLLEASSCTNNLAINLALYPDIENLRTGSGDDFLGGNASDNALYGQGGDDELYGADGNDTLCGGSGDDVLAGGLGNDCYIWGLGDDNDSIDSFVDGADNGYDTAQVGFKANECFLQKNVSDLIIGVNVNGKVQTLTFNNWFLGDRTNPLHAVDQLQFADGTVMNASDIEAVIGETSTGGTGKTLEGTNDAEVISGFAGSDLLCGLGGNDLLFGGTGSDVMYGGSGADTIYGGFDREDQHKKYAIVVGISNYLNPADNLITPKLDAFDVTRFLESTPGWQGADVNCLIDKDATREAILRSIDGLVSKVKPGDEVLLFYSGHGMSTGDLVPYDCTNDAGGISVADMEYSLSNLSEAIGDGHITLMLDSCYSGNFVTAFAGNPAVTVFSSSSADGISIGSGALQNGVFSYFFIEQGLLKGKADLNLDGFITNSELYSYGSSYVEEIYPTMHPAFTGNEDSTALATYLDNDQIDCGDGNDLAYGGAGRDTMYGGSGNDTLYGDDGSDLLYGDLACETVATDGLPLAIPDSGSVKLEFMVSDNLVVQDLDVGLSLASTDMSDLECILTGPDGTQITLFNNMRQTAKFMDIILDDSAAKSIGQSYVQLIDKCWPLNSLTVYSGKMAQGKWTLEIKDNISGDVSTIKEADLNFSWANAGNDSLIGGSGDDSLYGGAGDDYLAGGSGNDILSGGQGVDTYCFDTNSANDILVQDPANFGDTLLLGGYERISDWQPLLSGNDLYIDGYNNCSMMLDEWAVTPGARIEQFNIGNTLYTIAGGQWKLLG